MSGPDWLNGLFAAMVVTVALYSVGRLVASRSWSRPTHGDVDFAHVLMGTAMAGMFVSALNPIPSGVWEVVFSGVAIWFVWRCTRFVAQRGLEGRDEDHVHHLSHYLTHVVMAGAMLYMYAVATTPEGALVHAGMAMNGATGSAANFAGVPLLLLVVLLASGVWELDGVGRFSPARPDLPLLVRAGTGAIGWTPGGTGGPDPLVPPEDIDLASPPRRPWLAPRLEAGCHIAMCVAMGYMLVLIL